MWITADKLFIGAYFTFSDEYTYNDIVKLIDIEDTQYEGIKNYVFRYLVSGSFFSSYYSDSFDVYLLENFDELSNKHLTLNWLWKGK